MSDHLHRSRTDRMLAGVAGGLAEMWDADPSLVRLVWALLVVFTGGIALLVYIVMAIVVPEEDEDDYVRPAPPVAPPYTGAAASDAAPVAPGRDTASLGTPSPASAPPASPGAVPAATTPPPSYWLPGTVPSRAEARAARRAARRQRGDGAAAAIIGVFLVLIGGFFLAREWLPDLDWNWFWPAMLIVLGVLLLVLAMGRRDDRGGLS